jgi:hypothetical protein
MRRVEGLHQEEDAMRVQIRRVCSIFSLRKWKDLLTRGENWFIAFGRLYIVNLEGTQSLRNKQKDHPFPGKNGKLFRRLIFDQRAEKQRAEAVLVAGLGRFGNGIQQFLHARAFATAVGVNSVLYFPNENMVLKSPGRQNQDTLIPLFGPFKGGPAIPVAVWRSDFFDSGAAVHYFDTQSCDDLRDELRDLYWPLISDDQGDDQTLTIHLRSGDVFRTNPHPGYGQPPLSFYERIIDSRAWEKLLIIAEDTLNPCHEGILKYAKERQCEVETKGLELAEATRAICESKHLVASRGTFVPAVVYLTKNEKTIYQFETNIDVVPSPSENVYRTIFDLRGDYSREILASNWRNTRQQRSLMLSYPKENLSTISTKQ